MSNLYTVYFICIEVNIILCVYVLWLSRCYSRILKM